MKPIDLIEFLITYSFFLISAAVHESAHAWSAYKFGDPTAKLQNRISLNPAHHIDIVGTVIIPFMVFLSGIPVIGWAKPTPINPSNFQNPRRDGMYVSGAGPVSNLLTVIFLAILWHVARYSIHLEGNTISAGDRIALLFCYVFATGVAVNIMLAIFNMLPIHPLDGSGVLEGLLPEPLAQAYGKLRPYGFIILLLLFYLSPFSVYFRTVIDFVIQLFGIQRFSLRQIW